MKTSNGHPKAAAGTSEHSVPNTPDDNTTSVRTDNARPAYGNAFNVIRWAREEVPRAYGKDLTANECHVLLVLATYCDRHGKCWPAVKRIAADCSLGERSVTKAIKGLRERGIINVVRRWNDSSIYWLGANDLPAAAPEVVARVAPLDPPQVPPNYQEQPDSEYLRDAKLIAA